MEHTLSIHGSSIASLDDLYEEILEQMPEKRIGFGYNLDALFDILSDDYIDRIVIHKPRHLKNALHQEGEEGLSDYYRLLDVFTDLDHVDVILQDD